MTELELAGKDVALFCSDMHLGDHAPATAALFFDRLDAQIGSISHLLLLGDLFEAWVGDDQPDAAAAALIDRLRRFTAAGGQALAMRGNRDFLLDVPFPPDSPAAGTPRFSVRSGARLLDDPTRVRLFGEPVLLAHGDALCTADHGYQQMRGLVRTPAWQAGMLQRPLLQRLALARQLRDDSEQKRYAADGPGSGAQDPFDVVAGDVDAALTAADAAAMIHGHTHRPGCHRWRLDSRMARRCVLPDWLAADDAPDGRPRGGFLRIDAGGWQSIGLDGSVSPLPA
ncbi:MAG: UDP-2,3-diacylglucosamine diphosphatase [Burkholderiaceae bacterium]